MTNAEKKEIAWQYTRRTSRQGAMGGVEARRQEPEAWAGDYDEAHGLAGLEAYVFRPSDLFAGTILKILKGKEEQ